MDGEKHDHKRTRGYTLAEMVICLCIIGIIMSSAMTGAGRFFEGVKTTETRRQLDVVINLLSAYVQTHDRLPCPADPQAEPAQAGLEGNGGKCRAAAVGILPWKELAVPQSLTIDAWGNAIGYSPAPALTADMQAASTND